MHRCAIEPGVHWSHLAEVEDVLKQTGVAPEHVVWFCHVPVLSHCRTMVKVLSHWVLPATQVPAQTFPEQVELMHCTDGPHCPVLSQVCSLLLAAHRVSWGMHATQAGALLRQTGALPEQVATATYVPPMQCWTTFPTHIVSVGPHIPPHDPIFVMMSVRHHVCGGQFVGVP
jgi:hypothetical protein